MPAQKDIKIFGQTNKLCFKESYQIFHKNVNDRQMFDKCVNIERLDQSDGINPIFLKLDYSLKETQRL